MPSRRSDTDGSFTVDSLIPKLTVFSAFHPDHGTGTVKVDTATVADEPLSIVLQDGSSVTGTVTVGGVPQQHATIRIVTRGPNDEVLGVDTTKDDGTYRIPYQLEGTFEVSARLKTQGFDSFRRGRTVFREVTIQAGEETTLNFDFPDSNSSMSGVITVEGKPASNANVSYIIETALGEEANSVRSDGAGNYRFESIPAGDGTIVINAGSDQMNQRAITRSITIDEGNEYTKDFDLAGGHTLVAKLKGLEPEENHNQVFVIEGPFEGDDPPIGEFHHQRGMAKVEPDGTFRLEGMESGTYTLVISIVALNPDNTVANSRREIIHVDIPNRPGETTMDILV